MKRTGLSDKTIGWIKVATVVLLAIAASAIIVVVLYGAVTTDKVSDTQDQRVKKAATSDKVLQEVRDLAEEIRSCTQPEGECYKEGQARQGDALTTLFEYQIATATCIDYPGQQTEKEVRACANLIVKRQREAASTAAPSPSP